ncbi:MAG: HNH endonuclease signature motif containing protein [Citrobacter portucalensis]|nr:HNH endonuclease signature motif containing protein [Citrobacter portucalensis]
MNWNDVFHYSGGNLVWRKVNKNRYNKVGDVAGRVSKTNGYLYVKVNQVTRSVHTIIWEMFNGTIPDRMEIDHINHDRLDNRIENLRLVSHQDNAKNRSKTSRNTSGVVGVSWDKKRCKWYAFIKVDGVMRNLGMYSDFDAAVKVRVAAERKFNFHSNHGS